MTTAPTATAAPTVEIKIGSETRKVVFDFDRLVAIEEATGMGIFAVAGEIASYFAGGDAQQLSPEDRARIVQRLKLGFVRRLLAGVLGVPVEQVGKLLPVAEIRSAFGAVLPGLSEAIHQFNAEDDAGPTAAPAAASAG